MSKGSRRRPISRKAYEEFHARWPDAPEWPFQPPSLKLWRLEDAEEPLQPGESLPSNDSKSRKG